MLQAVDNGYSVWKLTFIKSKLYIFGRIWASTHTFFVGDYDYDNVAK